MSARGFIAAALVLAACAQEAPPESPSEPLPPVRAETAVDKAIATTGDVITYTVHIDRAANVDIQVPEAGAEIAGFRLIDLGRDPDEARDGRVVEVRWYKLRADLVGSYVLPPLRLRYRVATEVAPEGDAAKPADDAWQSLETSEIFVEVQSVLPTDGSAKDIRDLKPLRPVHSPTPWWVFVLAGLSLLIAGGIPLALVLRRRNAIEVPAPPAHEVAYAALEHLRQTDFNDPVALRRYYFALSEVLRTYVEQRFAINATDLTSEEIVPRLAALGSMAPSEQMGFRDFLKETDAVKFASYMPQTAEIETTYEKALSFIEATHARPEPEQPEAAAA